MFWRERKKWIYFVKIGAWDIFRIGFRSIERILIVLNEEEKGKKSYISFSLGNNAKIKWNLNKFIAFKWFKTNKKHIINCALILNVKISRKNFFFFEKIITSLKELMKPCLFLYEYLEYIHMDFNVLSIYEHWNISSAISWGD